MKKDLRKQIKQDELVTSVGTIWSWFQTHRAESRVTLALVGLVALGAAGLSYFQSERAREAEQAFGQALEIYTGPIVGEVPSGPDRPPGTIYPSAEEKYRKAAAAFDGIERRYPSLPLALRARYYGALCRGELGQYDETEKTLKELASRREAPGLEPALARVALADLYRRRGRLDQAAEAYRQLADDSALPLPRDYALMALAGTLEDAHKGAEAAASYGRLAEEFPSSVYAAEARRRATYLRGGSEG